MTGNPQDLTSILLKVKTIALVGASHRPHRDSYRVMSFLQSRGYRVIPVNPRLAGTELLDETVYAELGDIPEPIDMVEIFRRSEAVPEVVDQTLQIDADVIWMQLGVIHQAAAEKARLAGRTVVMDRCPKIELLKLSA